VYVTVRDFETSFNFDKAVQATYACFPVSLLGNKVKVKFSHTRYRALGPELIPVNRQSARR